MIDEDLPVAHAGEAFTDDGRLENAEPRERYAEILAELVSQAEQLSESEPIAA